MQTTNWMVMYSVEKCEREPVNISYDIEMIREMPAIMAVNPAAVRRYELFIGIILTRFFGILISKSMPLGRHKHILGGAYRDN